MQGWEVGGATAEAWGWEVGEGWAAQGWAVGEAAAAMEGLEAWEKVV